MNNENALREQRIKNSITRTPVASDVFNHRTMYIHAHTFDNIYHFS